MSNSILVDSIRAAANRRRDVLSGGVPVRVLDDVGDGLPGVWADRYGDALALVHVRGEDASDFGEFRTCAGSLAEIWGVKTIYGRIHTPRAATSAAVAAELLFGPPASEMWVREGSLEYLLRPEEQVNAGLFVDMRGVRENLQATGTGLRVLNTFAFTGSLGLAALAGGAAEVVQVDVSKRILSWAKENLDRNRGVCGNRPMRFIPEDSRVFMERELRRMGRGAPGYDLVIIDPPSFGASGKRAFRLADEYRDLIADGMALLGAGGCLLFTANLRALDSQELERACRERAAVERRVVRAVEAVAPPADFTAPPGSGTSMVGVRVWME